MLWLSFYSIFAHHEYKWDHELSLCTNLPDLFEARICYSFVKLINMSTVLIFLLISKHWCCFSLSARVERFSIQFCGPKNRFDIGLLCSPRLLIISTSSAGLLSACFIETSAPPLSPSSSFHPLCALCALNKCFPWKIFSWSLKILIEQIWVPASRQEIVKWSNISQRRCFLRKQNLKMSQTFNSEVVY